jgi:diguanylate cyclase (GGDEF)-like protein
MPSTAAPIAFWRGVRDGAGVLVDLELLDASEAFAAWLGRGTDEVVGRRYSELIPTGLRRRLRVYLRALQDRTPARVAFRRDMPGGLPVDAEVLVIPFGNDELLSALWDVSEPRRQVDDLVFSRLEAVAERDLFVAALDAVPDAVAVCRIRIGDVGEPATVLVEFVNEMACGTSGHQPETSVGTDAPTWFRQIDQEAIGPQILEAALDHLPRRLRLGTSPTDGGPGESDVVVTPFGNDRLIVTWRPADGETGSAGVLPAHVRTDSLTGLLTRSEFRRRLAQWMRAAGPVAGIVLALDLDDFGRLNDIVGPRKADAALALIGAQVRQLEPSAVLGARIGADEVAMLIPGAIDDGTLDLVHAQIARILTTVASRLALPPLSVSAGVRMLDAETTVEEVLRDCDTAVRHSQRSGGGTVTVFSDEVRHSLLLDYLWAEDIRTALDAGQFRLAFQPIVDVASGARVGEEALLRWEHSSLGLLPPDRFIPAAEATGTIVDLGGWAIDRGVARAGGRAGGGEVGINVSAVQLLRTDVPEVVARALERHRVDPGRVVIEVTESAILPESSRIREQLVELRRMGVLVAVDDFGSGYSSIAYLDWIPADVVKLDRRFLLGDLGERRQALLAATVGLVHSVGATCLVEGVETAEQHEMVRAAGADLAQGYLFGRPDLDERV